MPRTSIVYTTFSSLGHFFSPLTSQRFLGGAWNKRNEKHVRVELNSTQRGGWSMKRTNERTERMLNLMNLARIFDLARNVVIHGNLTYLTTLAFLIWCHHAKKVQWLQCAQIGHFLRLFSVSTLCIYQTDVIIEIDDVTTEIPTWWEWRLLMSAERIFPSFHFVVNVLWKSFRVAFKGGFRRATNLNSHKSRSFLIFSFLSSVSRSITFVGARRIFYY